MTTYFTSDLHLGHARIIELCGRPFKDVDEMNRVLVDNWNDTVRDTDVVYILGDLVMGKFAETIDLVAELKGTKLLIPGNHDRVHPAYHDKRTTKKAQWWKMYEAAGVVIMPNQMDHKLLDVPVRLCHFPYVFEDDSRPEHQAFHPGDDGRWLLHGHVHEAWKMNRRQINVGVDIHGFTPIPEDYVLEMIDDVTDRSDGHEPVHGD